VDDDGAGTGRGRVVQRPLHLFDRRPARGVVEAPEVPVAERRVQRDRDVVLAPKFAEFLRRRRVRMGVQVLALEFDVVQSAVDDVVGELRDGLVEPEPTPVVERAFVAGAPAYRAEAPR